jgi:hypothetical protein
MKDGKFGRVVKVQVNHEAMNCKRESCGKGDGGCSCHGGN